MAQFTKRAIIDVFLRLLEEMPLDKITVRDITRECNISRNTFYYHFGDIYALLESLIGQDIQTLRERRVSGVGWKENLRAIFAYLTENRKRIYHVYRSVNHDILERYLFQYTEELFLDYLLETAEGLAAAEEDIQTVCFAYQSMFIGFLMGWLRHGMRGDPNIMLDRIARLMQGSTRHILENSTKQPADTEGKAGGSG